MPLAWHCGWRKSAAALLLGAAAAVTGCSGADRADVWSNDIDGDSSPLPSGEAPCTTGATRECHETLSAREGILTCSSGTQTCDGGRWGQCESETLSELAVPSWYGQTGGLRAQALPIDCNPENPCDPSCQQYEEEPDGGVGPTLEDIVIESEWPWEWGSLADFPGGLVSKGLIQPCHTAADCQFNMYCEHPDSGDCAHSMCESGAALEASCDDDDSSRSCVQQICDIEPSCCVTETEACEHSLCREGGELKSGCGADAVEAQCSEAVCDAIPSCCTGSWDATCIAAVNTYCEPLGLAECACQDDEVARTVGGVTSCYYFDNSINKSWSNAVDYCEDTRTGDASIVVVNDATENAFVQGELDGDSWIGVWAKKIMGTWTWVLPDGSTPATYTNWNAPTPSPGSNKAAWMKAADGKWWSDTYTNTRGVACEGTPSKYVSLAAASTSEWTSECVDMVKTVCGATCDTTAPIDETGECKQYAPGYVDSSCSGVNLTVAPTCARDDVNVVPVCNHGSSTAPAGLRIISFQGNSSHFPVSSPDIDDGDIVDTCYTTEEIPPGECIEVLGCELDNNGEVVVNPQTSGLTSPSPISECNVEDNWTLVHPGSSCSSTCGESDGFYGDFTTDSCAVDLPSAEYEDASLVTITHVFDDGVFATGDVPLPFARVDSLADCGTGYGWYYDDNASPNQFILCPAACTRVKDTSYVSSQVYLGLSCQPVASYEEASYRYVYSGECGFDRGVQWGDLGYDATIESDATIEVRIAAAAQESDLPAEDKTDPGWGSPIVLDASLSSCPLNSACMIDLYSELGELPTATLPYLAILITVIPSSDNLGPVMNDWDIRYSCPFNQ